ncbi:DUF968 domain-containing protein [Citrobacter koseri]|uniref:DUF968 domain-containing protein n=1 Tax=Citrobacter koseri TaxID=545 RepID=UPI0028BDFCB8|nr:DUF968 domain-containing protein [Citrobacter koseri]MDT7455283.1 DUF968 domain-containing protein [Citrobacter koseri]MDT7503289.1 DUF968 domain-containing protein [Citrobacter koseri]HEM6812295.1 DUF968 domain-containing protein [Citrobacter koseri]
MRALLKPVIVREMGLIMLKPGSELLGLFHHGRVLIEKPPEYMTRWPSGKIPDARQPLAEDSGLVPFFTDERVIRAAGGITALEEWLRHRVSHCQWPHSEYHHSELVNMRYEPGAIRVCWHCDNQLREQATEQLSALARKNLIEWVIDNVLAALRCGKDRELSLAELCWWAVYSGVAAAIPEGMASRALALPNEPLRSVYKESEIVPSVPATSILEKRLELLPGDVIPVIPATEPAVTLTVDPESPQTLMKRPKRIRWVNPEYVQWVKTQPCECCGMPSDDPHHLIGHGQGGMGTKAHDSFTLPLCREHHTELHNDPVKFERKYGSQLEMLKNVLDRAFALGVLA